MIAEENYSIEYILSLKEKYKSDPSLIERVLFAFGLLEALRLSELPFIFKGGTCLILLLNEPSRFSTDIDILVEPDIDIDQYLEKVKTIFPFKRKEEQIRKGNSLIIKRHFKFFYDSPVSNKEFFIILDVVFEENPYSRLILKDIKNEIIKTNDPYLNVKVPSINCILGDKLTAFAPNTIGVPFGKDKELEIIKQLHDCSILMEHLDNIDEVKETYLRTAYLEIEFRNIDITFQDSLDDTINACLSIISRGSINKDDFEKYYDGIKRINNHILNKKYSLEVACFDACRVLFLASCLRTGFKFERIENIDKYKSININDSKFSKLKYMKKIDLKSYGYIVESLGMLGY